MQQVHDPIALEKVARTLAAQMLRAAIAHTNKLDARVALGLEQSGLFTRGSVPPLPASLLAILEDPNHPDRVPDALGPTLLYRDGANMRYALEMEYLLLSDDVRLRKASWHHFDSLRNSSLSSITEATYAILQNVRNEILADDRKRWRPAALQVYDALEDDICCVITGVKQGVLNKFEDGLRKYVPKLLRPTIDSLDRLALPFVRPSQERDKIEAAIGRIADSNLPVSQRCETYIRELGFLPLGNKLSFSAFAGELVARSSNPNDVVKQIWEWATNSNDHLAIFHASIALLDHPAWINQVGSNVLLEAVTQLFQASETQQEQERDKQRPFALRDELAKYYLNYLELIAPGSHGEVLATWAWWLANQVGGIFITSPDTLDRFKNVALLPQRQETDVSWRLANAKVLPSRLSVATHWPAPLWCLALTKRLNVENLKILVTADVDLEPLAKTLTPCLLFGNLPNTEPSETETYLFEGDLASCIDAWTEVCGPSDRLQFWRELRQVYGQLSEPSQFLDKLKSASGSETTEQIILSHGARRLHMEGRLPIEQIFEAMDNKTWRRDFFSKLNLAALELIASTLIWAAVDASDKWRFAVGHLLASICEETDADAERRELLFSLVVCACISSYSVSAIERLLKSRSRLKYVDAARKWSATLGDLNSTGPRWIGARGRAVHAAIGTCLSVD